MDFLSDYSRFENLLERNNTWKLLRAKSAPFIISFLKNIFAEEREVEYEVARANLKEFLEELKTKLEPDEQRRSAKDYLNEWMNRGWIRELNNRITMTDAAQKAIAFCERLDTKVISTSATHLEILQQEIQKLFVQIGTDRKLRVRELNQRIKELEAEKKLINAGQEAELSEYQQHEKIKAIYDLASRLPDDFRKLEEETVEIAQAIRIRMIENADTKGQIIADVLKDEEVQRRTEYGAAYEGFFTLICEKERSDKFRAQMDYILSKPIASHLEKRQQVFLHSLIDVLVHECDRVMKVRSRIDANLRSYLESSDFRENHRINQLIQALEQEAVKLKDQDFNMFTRELDLTLEKASIRVQSIESLSDALKLPPKTVELGELSEHENSREIRADLLSELDTVRLSEVFERIRNRVGRTSQLSVGSIIETTPLRHGLEEVVAFVRVARELNAAPIEDTETIVVSVSQGGEAKRLKITLPKIVLNAQMIKDHENSF